MLPVTAQGRLGLLLAYCLLNLLFFVTVEPYHPAGDELLSNPDLTQGLVGWRLQGNTGALSRADGVLTLDHPTADSTTLAQCWPKSALPQSLLLSAEARSEAVERGTKPWHEARIDLVGYDAADRGQYQVRTRLLSLEGDSPWQAGQALFHPLPEAQTVCLEISLYSAPGRFQVRALSLTRGVASRPFQAGRAMLLAGWLLLAFWLGLGLYRYYRGRTLGRWLMLAAGLVLAGVLMPQGLRQQLEASILGLLASIGLPVASVETPALVSAWTLWPSHWDLSKVSHLIGFALLGMLLSADRAARLGTRIGALLLLALTSEMLQFFVPLRTPRLSDLVVDGVGIAIGMTLAMILAGLVARWGYRRE